MKRKVVVNFIETNNLNNARLVEYFANRIKERGINNENL